jgi:molybdopterin-guanine dinucleotide biosynthesis protein A
MSAMAGFVLTGGQSSRMGRDKALLAIEGTVLVARTATLVRTVTGNVTLIGAPERYTQLGFPSVADLIPDSGPIGGLYTALHTTRADWNLLVACDMPRLTEAILRELLAAAAHSYGSGSGAACLVPETASGLHPLCAVYHRCALPTVQSAIEDKRFKMHDLLMSLEAEVWPVADSAILENVNTPQEWGAR